MRGGRNEKEEMKEEEKNSKKFSSCFGEVEAL
jgi:hypothetical protein